MNKYFSTLEANLIKKNPSCNEPNEHLKSEGLNRYTPAGIRAYCEYMSEGDVLIFKKAGKNRDLNLVIRCLRDNKVTVLTYQGETCVDYVRSCDIYDLNGLWMELKRIEKYKHLSLVPHRSAYRAKKKEVAA